MRLLVRCCWNRGFESEFDIVEAGCGVRVGVEGVGDVGGEGFGWHGGGVGVLVRGGSGRGERWVRNGWEGGMEVGS